MRESIGVPVPMPPGFALDPIWGGQNLGIKWRGVKPYGYGVSKGGGQTLVNLLAHYGNRSKGIYAMIAALWAVVLARATTQALPFTAHAVHRAYKWRGVNPLHCEQHHTRWSPRCPLAPLP